MLSPIVTQFTGNPPNDWRCNFTPLAVTNAARVVVGVGLPLTVPRRLSFDLGETTHHERPNERPTGD